MPKTKKQTANHSKYGEVVVSGGWRLEPKDSNPFSGEPYVDCDVNGIKRKLLLGTVADAWWVSDLGELEAVHKLMESKEVLRRKTILSKGHKSATTSSKKNFVAANKRLKSAASDSDEIDDLKTNIAEMEEGLQKVQKSDSEWCECTEEQTNEIYS